jgi:hypothetical protein
MNASEWPRIGTLCHIRRVQAKLSLIDMQELLGTESISFILRMERGEFDPELLWNFWVTRDPYYASNRLSA